MQKIRIAIFLGLLSFSVLTLSSCASLGASGSYHSKLYKKGSKAKGVVAMLPVYYREGKSSEMLSWNLQTEFSEEISKRFLSSEKILLIKHSASPQAISQFYAPRISNLPQTIARQFLPAEFIVATELLEQKSIADTFGNDSLTVSVRVRVFDIRHNQIALIYQEIIEANQPSTSVISDYSRYGWQTKHFDSTPMGLMHHRLFREIVARVEGYVCANYS
ncbi:CT253 family lipoprotein [Chlamydia sp. 17-3921]|uniref:CT253 family lipoprotein n=1 Tax=Chlamydia sp. 17-3921 TaxID=2675798 RepID=UPI00191AC45C|nr:CT253 family lipoprotein [Chlamydia sp. 17-3921]